MDDISFVKWSDDRSFEKRTAKDQIHKFIVAKMNGGFSLESSADLSAGMGFDIDLLDEVLGEMRNQAPQQQNAMPAINDPLPITYAHVKANVDRLIQSMSPQDATDIFVGAREHRHAMVKLSGTQKADLQKLCSYATKYKNSSVIDEIHDIVRPYIENALIESRMAAKTGNWAVQGSQEGTYSLSDGKASFSVNPNLRLCSCDRFVEGGFDYLGVPCEHIVAMRQILAGPGETVFMGTKKVYAQNREGTSRFGWCPKWKDEVKMELACKKAQCPFYDEDHGDYILCNYED